jgi:hypothetical protein
MAEVKGLIMVNEYELLELFESEPKVLGDKKAGIYEYQKTCSHGFTFRLCLFLYDEYCSISLYHKDLKTPIFDLGFDKVTNIKCKDNRLIIDQTGNPKNIVVHFKPNYTLVFEDRI